MARARGLCSGPAKETLTWIGNPMKRTLTTIAVVVALGIAGSHAQQAPRTQLVIVVDGLRPDYVTLEVMPRLFRLGQRGVVFNAHHSVFPTVTRVNASSFVTGAYPETHGLLGNIIFIPKANATKGLDTGERTNLEAVERAEGTLLTAPTLSEILKPEGKTLLAVSSGSSGSAYLLNHTLATGGIVFGLYGFAFIGGWVEQFGALLQNDTAIKVGIITSLIIPSESLWRRAAFEMQAPITGSFGSPFTTTSVPSLLMIGYAVLYLCFTLILAIRIFQKRDL